MLVYWSLDCWSIGQLGCWSVGTNEFFSLVVALTEQIAQYNNKSISKVLLVSGACAWSLSSSDCGDSVVLLVL